MEKLQSIFAVFHSVLELDSPVRRVKVPLDTYKEDKKAQKAQKKAHNQKSRGDTSRWVKGCLFTYPKTRITCKAYKFARPFHGAFRVTEVLDTGVPVRPVYRPQEGSIRVALNRISRCPHAVASDVFGRVRSPASNLVHEGRQRARNPKNRASQDLHLQSRIVRCPGRVV